MRVLVMKWTFVAQRKSEMHLLINSKYNQKTARDASNTWDYPYRRVRRAYVEKHRTHDRAKLPNVRTEDKLYNPAEYVPVRATLVKVN